MKKYLLPASILLGVIFNFLFWEKIPGISFPLFVSLCLLGGFGLISASGGKPAKINILLIGVKLAFACMTFIRREPFTSFLNYALTLSAMVLLAGTFLSGEWIRFNLVDYVSRFFHLFGGMIDYLTEKSKMR